MVILLFGNILLTQDKATLTLDITLGGKKHVWLIFWLHELDLVKVLILAQKERDDDTMIFLWQD